VPVVHTESESNLDPSQKGQPETCTVLLWSTIAGVSDYESCSPSLISRTAEQA
jgi:hypothetical protein